MRKKLGEHKSVKERHENRSTTRNTHKSKAHVIKIPMSIEQHSSLIDKIRGKSVRTFSQKWSLMMRLLGAVYEKTLGKNWRQFRSTISQITLQRWERLIRQAASYASSSTLTPTTNNSTKLTINTFISLEVTSSLLAVESSGELLVRNLKKVVTTNSVLETLILTVLLT